MTHYTCVGSVCGGCDIKHLGQIQRGNTSGAYSDRRPVAVENGIRRRLTDDEIDEMERW